MSKLLREYIQEVLVGFGNKQYGKDGVAGPLHPTGAATGDAGVRPQASSNVLEDEDAEEAAQEQGAKCAACCLILTNDGHALAVSRKNDPSAFGLPGGKVDPGETPEQAAARELQEETGRRTCTRSLSVGMQTASSPTPSHARSKETSTRLSQVSSGG